MDSSVPFSEEAETGVVSCCLQAPDTCIDQANTLLADGEATFHDIRIKRMFKLLNSMNSKDMPIDPITINNAIKDDGGVRNYGGGGFVNSLWDASPSPLNIEYYIPIVNEKYKLRRLTELCKKTSIKAIQSKSETDSEELLAHVEEELSRIIDNETEESDELDEAVSNVINHIERCHNAKGALSGLKTGFVDLDKITNGLQNGDMFTLAARPGLGKTALSVNICANTAIDERIPVGIFSLEMTKESLVMRMICSRTRTNSYDINQGKIADNRGKIAAITKELTKIKKAPLYIDDRSGLTIESIKSKAKVWKRKYGIKLLVIDYIQLIKAENQRDRRVAVDDICRGVKSLAKKLRIPVISICQMNRSIEREKGRRPRLSDLRESGELEQTSDVIGFLYSTESNEEEPKSWGNESVGQSVDLIIAKQRQGPVGDIPLLFFKQYTLFLSNVRNQLDGIPASEL